MSERLEFDPENMPHMKLDMADGEFIATPMNSTLFTYLGRLACYDHVFLQTGDEDEKVIHGTYVFNQHPVYAAMKDFMLEFDFPASINRIEVADCDVDAWLRMTSQYTEDLGDFLPDGWDV